MPSGIYKRTELHRKINSLGHLGKKLTEEHKKSISKGMVGEKLHNWKGDDVGYRGLHNWIERQLGKPPKCSDCGKVGYGRQMHWANVSGEYKRDVSDWQRLCAKCHWNYDKENRLRVFRNQYA